MKLVEILAKELSEWPESAVCITQDSGGTIYGWVQTGAEYRNCAWYSPDGEDFGMHDIEIEDPDEASDNKKSFVTKAQWQAERDRQNGCEWKRARGSKPKYETETPQRMEVRHRDGDITKGWTSQSWNWSHNDGCPSADIMAWRIISQPQAEEPAVNVFVGKDVNIEYAFSQDGVALENLDWKPLGNAVMGDVEFDSMKAEEVEVKDTTIGTLSYKVEIDTTEASQAIDDLTAKLDQIETPFKWRDEVTELNAYIEKYTRERDALIERLASEGFALIPPVVSVVSEFSGVDMSDWRNWKAGDVVESREKEEDIHIGEYYVLTEDVDPEDGEVYFKDSNGDDRHRYANKYRFISRP